MAFENITPAASGFGDSELHGSLPSTLNDNLENPGNPQLEQELVSHPSLLEGTNSGSDDDKDKDKDDDTEDYGKTQRGARKAKREQPQWKRVEWTNAMVKFLITAVTYLNYGVIFEGCACARRKSKWNSVAQVMAENGFSVLPYECEDKFNEINNNYMRLFDIIGKENANQIVKKPQLLDLMDNLSEITKDEVRKILGSTHLFYEELRSYHNNYTPILPYDLEFQQYLKSDLSASDGSGSSSDSDSSYWNLDDSDEDDDFEEYEEEFRNACLGDPIKRMKLGQDGLENNISVVSKSTNGFRNGSFDEYLEEMKLQLEIETLELERKKLKWQEACKRKDRELDKLRARNEKMKLENQRIALHLKRLEMCLK